MTTPTNRTPVRVARGNATNIATAVAAGDIQEGEIVYVHDENRLYVKESTGLVSTQAALPATNAVTDTAQTFTAAQRGQVTTLTSAASITIDFAVSNNFILTTGHAAILFANPTTEVAGQSGSIFIVQGSTTCAAPTWGNQWYFAGGTAPALTGTTGKCARIDYIVQAAGKIHAVATDNLTYTS